MKDIKWNLRLSFYLAHYLICRGGEFGLLIFNPQLGFTSSLHDASLHMHSKPCQVSKFPVKWSSSKTMIPPLILPHDLIHLGISPSLESNHSKGLPSKEVLQNNIAQKKISILGSWFMTHDPIVWYQWRYQLRIFYGGSQNHETSMTWAKLSTSMCTKW